MSLSPATTVPATPSEVGSEIGRATRHRRATGSANNVMGASGAGAESKKSATQHAIELARQCLEMAQTWKSLAHWNEKLRNRDFIALCIQYSSVLVLDI